MKFRNKLAATILPETSGRHLTITGGKGLVYELESSADLTNWTSIAPLTNQTGEITFTNQLPKSDLARFFRAREQ